jgi:hypothetical protein
MPYATERTVGAIFLMFSAPYVTTPNPGKRLLCESVTEFDKRL